MEQTAIILIIITLFLLVVIVGLLTVLIFKMFNQNTTQVPTPVAAVPAGALDETPRPDITKKDLHPAIVERFKEIEKLKPKRSELFCPNHPEEPGETMCAICDKIFCKTCIKSFKSLHYCKEHLPLVMRYDWEEVLTLKTSTQDPEKGVKLYHVKKDIFESQNIPTYVETHYKINVDQDFIETYLVLFAQKDEIPKVRDLFQSFL